MAFNAKDFETQELYRVAARKDKLIAALTETISMMEKQFRIVKAELAEYKRITKLRKTKRVVRQVHII
jgi:hypothetical protein